MLDSYAPGEAIVSRKLTQFADIHVDTGLSYIDELAEKYPTGALIDDVPSTRASGLAGRELTGRLVLEIPPQAAPIPEEILIHAFENRIRIVDINGNDYTRHLFPPD